MSVGAAPSADTCAVALARALAVPTQPGHLGTGKRPPQVATGKRDPEAIRTELVEIHYFAGVSGGCLSLPSVYDQAALDSRDVAGQRQFVRCSSISEVNLTSIE